MRYGNDYQFTPDMPQDYIKHMAAHAERDLLDNVLSSMEHGKHYVICIDDIAPHWCGDRLAAGFRVNVTECRTETVRMPTAEEAMLVPQSSVWGRLKNCMRYMKTTKRP